ncbi:MAG TPA: choice-of-anchor D domain-containing protein, partial [Steroidobacteraceae bacterium]|nr:choice-of-anchor D domain-containing protein [Steroidobacteraceae bacterium]
LTSLAYFTYLGGSNNISGLSDSANAIAVDSAGDAVIAGGTYDSACNDVSCTGGAVATFPIPVTAGFQATPGGTNEAGYLAKINATGTSLLYLSFLGGGNDSAAAGGGTQINALTLDAGGNAYVGATTAENALPTFGTTLGQAPRVCQTNSNGQLVCPGGFIAKVNMAAANAPSLLFSAYLGGVLPQGNAGTTKINGIALDGSQDLYVAGSTSTTDMPEPGTVNSPNGLEPSSTLPCAILLPECVSPYVVELAPGAASILYSGYLAGTGGGQFEQDAVAGVGVDSSGDVFLAGTEATNDFPVTTNGADQDPPEFGSSSSYLAEIGGLPNGAGTPSNATYTLNGAAPTAGGATGYFFEVSTTATTSLAVPVLLTNTGGSSLTISSVSLTLAGSAPWTLTSLSCNGNSVPLPIGTPVNLAAGESCTIQLNYDPPTVSPSGQVAYLQVLDSASDSNAPGASGSGGQSLEFVGTAITAPPPAFASYSINGAALSDPNIFTPASTLSTDVNTTATTTLVLTNTGGEPFALSGVSLSSTLSPDPWSITQALTCPEGTPTAATPVTLQAGESCSMTLQFAPTSTTTPQDVLVTVLDAASASNLPEVSGNTGQNFIIEGDLGQPFNNLSSTSVDLGAVTATVPNEAGSGPATQMVTVTNTGTGPLSIIGDSVTNPVGNTSAFSISNTCVSMYDEVLAFPVTLAIGASCTFTLQFNPSPATGAQVGAESATALFITNAAQSDVLTETLFGQQVQELPLSGTYALPPPQYSAPYAYFSPGLLQFNGTGVQQQTVTVTNIGAGTLALGSPSLVGADAFSLASVSCLSAGGATLSFPATLNSYDACTYTFQFDPSVTGSSGTVAGGDVTGGLAAQANYTLSAASNEGIQNPSFYLFGPGASIVCRAPPSPSFIYNVAQGPWEQNPRTHVWSQSITYATPGGLNGGLVPTTVDLVFEGLNTTLENYIDAVGYNGLEQGPFTTESGNLLIEGYIDNAGIASECGDVLNSPYIGVSIEIYGPPGGFDGPASTGSITLQFAPVSTSTNRNVQPNVWTQPSYTLKVFNPLDVGAF